MSAASYTPAGGQLSSFHLKLIVSGLTSEHFLGKRSVIV